MKDPQQVASTLNTIILSLDETLEALDVSYAPCETCGNRHHTNWDDFQAAQALLGARNRLAKTLRKMAEGEHKGVNAVMNVDEQALKIIDWNPIGSGANTDRNRRRKS